jgi:transposase
MARAYSQDLRDRVIDAALAGLPARQAAIRFGVGIATAIVWVGRARETGERTARRQGQPRRSKLDAHREFLLGLVDATPDMTLAEMRERLAAERGITASVGTIWTFLDRAGLTFKKSPPMPPSRIGLTSWSSARPGLRVSLISIRRGLSSSMKQGRPPTWRVCVADVRRASVCALASRKATGRPRPLLRACGSQA